MEESNDTKVMKFCVEVKLSQLKEKYNLEFKYTTEDEAILFLKKFHYIYVIEPFKHFYYKKDNRSVPILNQNNKLDFYQTVDFNEYLTRYVKERDVSLNVYKSILSFEYQFRTNVAYFLECKFEKNNSINLDDMRSYLEINTLHNTKLSITRRLLILQNIQAFIDHYNINQPILQSLDRLSLSKLIYLYFGFKTTDQQNIFLKMNQIQSTLGVDYFDQFTERLIRLVYVRNAIMHTYSLSLLIHYFSYEKLIIRKDTDRKKYQNLIKFLSNKKEST